jgi:hypothetical protein
MRLRRRLALGSLASEAELTAQPAAEPTQQLGRVNAQLRQQAGVLLSVDLARQFLLRLVSLGVFT